MEQGIVTPNHVIFLIALVVLFVIVTFLLNLFFGKQNEITPKQARAQLIKTFKLYETASDKVILEKVQQARYCANEKLTCMRNDNIENAEQIIEEDIYYLNYLVELAGLEI